MNERQKDYLKKIIDLYIEEGHPVGSKTFIDKYQISISSATVRHEMAQLEKGGYLEKSHTSSGRIPSRSGYEFYAINLADNFNKNISEKLEAIFSKRRVSIDLTLEEAATAISEMAGITIVTSDSETDELMKSIQLTPINEQMATIVIVTSTGRVESKIIELNKFTKIDDVRIAVRLFKDRLIDTRLKDLAFKVESLTSILAKSINNYEDLIRAFVSKIFDFNQKIQNKVYGNSNIIKSDIKREDLARLLDLIQNKSIFSAIEGKIDDDENIKIDIRPNNTSIMSTKVNHNNKATEISVIGSNRMDYGDAKKALQLIKGFLGGEDYEKN